MEDLKSKMQMVYYVSNGFMLSIALLLLIFETPEGFLHYSPGKWLDFTIVITAFISGIVFPILGRKIWLYFFNDPNKWSLETVATGYEIAIVMASWITVSLALLAFLYQTAMFARIWSTVFAVFALIACYPSQKRIDKGYEYFRLYNFS